MGLLYCKPVIYYRIIKVSIWNVWKKFKINKKIDFCVKVFLYANWKQNIYDRTFVFLKKSFAVKSK